MTRRSLLRAGAWLGGASLLSACSASGGTTHGYDELPYLKTGRPASSTFKPDLDITLTARPAEVATLPGAATRVWRLESSLISGDAAQLQTFGAESYLGPIIRAKRGQKIRIRYTNQLPEDAASNIHWHGLRVPNEMDGHPLHVIAPGKTFNYEFEVDETSLTAWFHPHPHGDTARQVYMGLAGMFIVNDPADEALNLPSGEFDLPLVIQDRSFDPSNQLLYYGRGMMGGRMEQMMGFYGERIMVNGRPDATFDVTGTAYRFRVLNASNARIYKLTWSDNAPMTAIATDGGLLETPQRRPYIMLAPGERVELWRDFAGSPTGTQIKLFTDHFEGAESVPVPAHMKERLGDVTTMAMHQSATEQGAVMDIATFRVTSARPAGTTPPVPASLRTRAPFTGPIAAQKTFEITHRDMKWMFNSRAWTDTLANEERVAQGSTEVWTFVNAQNPGESMDPMGMAHPIHLHGVHFNIIERKQLIPEMLPLGYDEAYRGWLDESIKDTFLLMPGEQIRARISFTQQKGRYVYHCHNLEHEDQGLMRNYEVT